MKKGYKYLTKEEFENMKLLQSAGLKAAMVIKVTKRSGGTVSAVFRSNTWEDYKKFNSEYRKAKENKKASILQGVGTDKIEVASIIPEPKDEIGAKLAQSCVVQDSLDRIAVALERLADAWEKTPSKKGWLK